MHLLQGKYFCIFLICISVYQVVIEIIGVTVDHSQKSLRNTEAARKKQQLLLSCDSRLLPGLSLADALLHTILVVYMFHINSSVQLQISQYPRFDVEEGILLMIGQISQIMSP